MKKNYLTLAAALFATATFAQTPISSRKSIVTREAAPSFLQTDKYVSLNDMQPAFGGRKVDQKLMQERRSLISGQNAIHKAPAEGLITEAPEGTPMNNVYEYAVGYLTFWGYVFQSASDGLASDVVVGNDGNIYFKNPISTISCDGWLKGHLNATQDSVIVDLPQPVYYQEGDDNYAELTAYAWKLNYDEEQSWFVKDSIDNRIAFAYKDGELEFYDNGNSIIGLTDETGEWYAYGDYYQYYTQENSTVEKPSDEAIANAEDYLLTYITDETDADNPVKDAATVKLIKDGGNIWLTDLTGEDDELYVKATANGNKYTITSNQYLGAPEGAGYHYYAAAEDYKNVYDEDSYEYYDSTYVVDKMDFAYDAEKETYTGDHLYLAINTGKISPYEEATFKAPVLSKYTELPGAPANPTISLYNDSYFSDYGYSWISFILPKFSTDGNYLIPTKLYYKLYTQVDGAVDEFTFFEDEYVKLGQEELTDVPYNFTDNYDIYVSGTTHTIYLYSTGFDKIGVQEYYLTDDGTKYESDIVWYDIAAAGIQNASVVENGKNISKTTYFDLSGRQVSQPQHGVFVKNVTYADGTTKAEKVVLK